MLLETTEGFSREEAYAAADRSGADYDQEAVYRALDIYHDNWVYLDREWLENPTWNQIETYLNKGFYFTKAQAKHGITQAKIEIENPVDPDPVDPDPDPDSDPGVSDVFEFEYDGQPHTFEFESDPGTTIQYRYLKFGTGSETWAEWSDQKPEFIDVTYANDENGVPYVDVYTVEVAIGQEIITKYVRITPKDAMIIVHDKDKNYGEEDPEFTYEIEGLVEGDDILVTKLQRYSEIIGDTPDEAPGLYAGRIIATFIVNPNYKTKVSLGDFTIYPLPETKDITVTKIWEGGPQQKPDITIQLFRNVEGENPKPYRDPVVLSSPQTTYTWLDVDERDEAGRDYIYSVDELNDLSDYSKSIVRGGFTIINTFKTPPVTPEPETVNIEANKVWVGGPEVKPTIELQLYRNDEAIVGRTATLENGTTTYTWYGLRKYDSAGFEYEYTVKEVSELENYTKVEDGLTVTNTYIEEVAKVDITGSKVWILGPEIKPTIELQLYRNGIAFGEPVELLDGTTSYKWTGLEKVDSEGNDYIYTIDEVSVPENYDKLISEDGLTITNIFFEVAGDVVIDDGEKTPADKTPPTGINNYGSLYAMTLVLGSAALFVLTKKREEEY